MTIIVKRTRIKICSICSPEDALVAVRSSADAVGLILHPAAKRYIPPETARQILSVLPPFITPVGVFVDATPSYIHETAASLGLRHIQLHGSETESDIASLSNFIVIKAVKVTRATFSQDLQSWNDIAMRHPNLHALVLETGSPHSTGGTGVENDWDAIAAVLASQSSRLPLIAAGGLRPDNVAAVIRHLHPYAVDVSSGVEASLRHKSLEKIIAFTQAVQSADASSFK